MWRPPAQLVFLVIIMQREIYYITSPSKVIIYQLVSWCGRCAGAGKTYTMLGRDDHPGIMAQALTELFTQMRRNEDDSVYKVTMSYLEV